MYKLKEVAEILGVSDRSVERYLKSYFSLEKGTYQVSEKMLEVLKSEYLESEYDSIVEEFTKDEYVEFQKRLSEYPLLKKNLEESREFLNQSRNDIEYHKKAYLKQLDIHEKLISTIHERNVLEAKDKRISFTNFIDLDPEKQEQ